MFLTYLHPASLEHAHTFEGLLPIVACIALAICVRLLIGGQR